MNDKLTIGEFSRFCNVTIKTLRHYERMKLLVPSEVDEWTHYRYYNVSQLQQLNGILRLKEMGFSLEEVRELQEEGTNEPSIKQLEGKITQTENLLDALHERLSLLKRMADMRTKIETMDTISIQHLPEIIVASSFLPSVPPSWGRRCNASDAREACLSTGSSWSTTRN